ncbi:unnamed protein product [Caenorhabditis brenneri]
MAVKSFPILRLPSLAREKVLKSLIPIQVFILSQFSRRMKYAVKSEYRNTGQELSVSVHSSSMLICTHFSGKITGEFYVNEIEISNKWGMRIESKYFKRRFIRLTLRIYNRNSQEYTKQLLEEFIDVFSFPIAKMSFGPDKEDYKSIIQWVNSYSQKTQLIIVNGPRVPVERYFYVLEHLESPNNVEFQLLIEDHDSRISRIPTFRAEKIKFIYGDFIRLRHLKSFSGKEYTIREATINDKELNDFLCGLAAGANPNLRRLKLERYGKAVIDDVLKNLRARKIGEYSDYREQWSFELENGNQVILTYDELLPNINESSIDIVINRD